MATIAIEGMRFYAYHGFYEEEQIIGGTYIVDVYIETNYKKAVANDDLYSTINYETLYLICQVEMRKKTRLIETLADRIVYGIKSQFAKLKEVKVRVRKLNPPLAGPVAQSYVETNESFVQNCSRCKKPMLCYGDKNCWCMNSKVPPKTREGIAIQYKGCICKECLAFYAG